MSGTVRGSRTPDSSVRMLLRKETAAVSEAGEIRKDSTTWMPAVSAFPFEQYQLCDSKRDRLEIEQGEGGKGLGQCSFVTESGKGFVVKSEARI
ncbi:hypothetical protein EVAR_53285_1 [Eumeta japonica]|uniref:Uncharacterized protein n=1 Tax=Eumeta variegata TaxID=151549 RepID=A0A4C1Z064_EUMVA|nr:hypothetical protein EVAR_53285_1 [Eumeta japonica]